MENGNVVRLFDSLKKIKIKESLILAFQDKIKVRESLVSVISETSKNRQLKLKKPMVRKVIF
jgi:hypothetical protein